MRKTILSILRESPDLTTRDIAERAGLAPKPVYESLSRMRADGLVRSTGWRSRCRVWSLTVLGETYRELTARDAVIKSVPSLEWMSSDRVARCSGYSLRTVLPTLRALYVEGAVARKRSRDGWEWRSRR